LKFKSDFHSKISVCRHELGEGLNSLAAIPTLLFIESVKVIYLFITEVTQYY